MRTLKGLRIRGIRVESIDLPLICQHRELEALVIDEADFDSKKLVEIRQLPNLKSLHLDQNKINLLEGCGPFPQVRILSLANNPIGDAGLAKLATVFPGLQSINLANTKITDAGLLHLKLCPDLLAINLTGTKVTGDGLLPIVANRTMSVRVNSGSFAKNTIEALKQINPTSLSIIEQTTNDIVRDAFNNRDQW